MCTRLPSEFCSFANGRLTQKKIIFFVIQSLKNCMEAVVFLFFSFYLRFFFSKKIVM